MVTNSFTTAPSAILRRHFPDRFLAHFSSVCWPYTCRARVLGAGAVPDAMPPHAARLEAHRWGAKQSSCSIPSWIAYNAPAWPALLKQNIPLAFLGNFLRLTSDPP